MTPAGRLPPVPDDLATPATVVFPERLERNIAAMADKATSVGAALRPHAKTHKCRQIAARQLALGARGLTVATLREAEILTEPGGAAGPYPDDVFVAYPMWPTDDLVRRLRDLCERATVRVGVDSADAAVRLTPLAGLLRVMIEVDCGLSRSGVQPGEVRPIAQAAASAGLGVAGVFTFPGHGYRPGAGPAAARDEREALAAAAGALEAAGFGEIERSGGSTPTAKLVRPGDVTELRPGVYVFNDAQQVELGTATLDDVALAVTATVVSRPRPGCAVLDSGSKVLGADRPAWSSGFGLLADWPAARITGLWEHHAVVSVEAGDGPSLGEQVAVVPNHVCNAVNLVPELIVVSDGAVVDRWPVAARAANG